jgi:hypothetical protein
MGVRLNGPQFDVLWPALTAREHLSLMAAVRGLPADEASHEATRLLAAVGGAAGWAWQHMLAWESRITGVPPTQSDRPQCQASRSCVLVGCGRCG